MPPLHPGAGPSEPPCRPTRLSLRSRAMNAAGMCGISVTASTGSQDLLVADVNAAAQRRDRVSMGAKSGIDPSSEKWDNREY